MAAFGGYRGHDDGEYGTAHGGACGACLHGPWFCNGVNVSEAFNYHSSYTEKPGGFDSGMSRGGGGGAGLRSVCRGPNVGRGLMMQPQLTTAIYPAFEILPLRMDSTEAAVMMLAIGLQESRFEHRVQLIGRSRHWWQSLNGPARGWWQFEKAGGVVGVLRHHASREYASDICELLRYPASAGPLSDCHQ